jgi:endonuclease YncB( thermonuclease family)
VEPTRSDVRHGAPQAARSPSIVFEPASVLCSELTRYVTTAVLRLVHEVDPSRHPELKCALSTPSSPRGYKRRADISAAANCEPESWAPVYWPTGPAKVIDGDTMVVAEQVVRLHGIDAPELDQKFW